ncbi:hypothetical protein HPP92_013927 [Vanilla planifolia]|uniref:RING-type domain-containing protein n=1 Tax=Vanilla planifolia TaxID=51239 RepID=A0A835R3D7_VANPL|nr:hypothetical protein HPP92_013927 [Vanilla planifolia]
MAELDSAAGNADCGSWQKAICTICFEDLKPIVEDLQTLSICGHVFHELCIQQWLEYCPAGAGKKPTCPVCKQSCSRNSLKRLYFQSTGEPTQISSFSMQGSVNADPQVLADELRRLHSKLAALNSTFENQQSHLKKILEELSTWKEFAKREQTKSEEIRKEKECNELHLHMKMEELSRKTLECSKLQERSLALAKELAAFKLVTDLNLDEDEMVKLASIGRQGRTENAVDVLKKSLLLRNKSYKELMIQCNMLGRSESRASQKLDKAKEKINKLKTKLLEVEKILDEKENRAIRDLKASCKLKSEHVNSSYTEHNIKRSLQEDQVERKLVEECFVRMNPVSNGIVQLSKSDKAKLKAKSSSSAYEEINNVIDLTNSLCNYANLDGLESIADGLPAPVVEDVNGESDGGVIPVKGAYAYTAASSKGFQSSKLENRSSVEEDADIVITKSARETNMLAREESHINDITKEVSPFALENEAASRSPACLSGPYISGGILSANGANRGSGKWCRLVKSRSSSGDLIAVGADGRGGRVKVLRSQEEFMVGSAMSLGSNSKRQKNETKQTNQFNIEHFFAKTQAR